MRNRSFRFLAGVVLISAAVGWLMWVGIRETSVYYLEIGEFLPQREALANTDLRVAGRVTPGSIEYDPRTLELRFRMGEFVEGKPSGDTVPVRFTGVKPDMLAGGRDVIVEGAYRGDVFMADKVLTSCPSKYEPEMKEGESASAPGEPA